MIDWAIVISTAVRFMVASVTKVGETFETKAGEELFDVVKKKFKNDKEGQRILSDFQKKPDWYQAALIGTLTEKAESDKSFGEEIRSVVEKMSTNVGATIQTIKGNNNIQAAGSTVSVNVSPNEEVDSAFGVSKKSKRK